jgi:hypothetical protein
LHLKFPIKFKSINNFICLLNYIIEVTQWELKNLKKLEKKELHLSTVTVMAIAMDMDMVTVNHRL